MNLFNQLELLPETMGKFALRLSTGANGIGAIAVIGQIAQVFSIHQPLLNAAFGDQRGAFVSLACFAVGQTAAHLASRSLPIGTGQSIANIVADVTVPIIATGTTAPFRTETLVRAGEAFLVKTDPAAPSSATPPTILGGAVVPLLLEQEKTT